MQITDFHAKYYAYILTGQRTDNSIDMLAATLQDSKVDLNPHQIEAALFALRSPFSKGIIEADEVGLGKTIVAGIVTAQKWAEGKQKVLIIVPANLRKQWQLELEEKFYLPSVIMDGESFKSYLEAGVQNPFEQDTIIITSYNFAHAKAEYIKSIRWELAILDEAHRLRNVYKAENVIARSIRDSLGDCFKLLLTATPLQNSLLELYGLVTFIDDYTFGDLDSFKAQFSFLRDENKYAFDDLVSRLKTLCIRTLRRQVLEYIKYTERLPITQEFMPTPAEQELYDKFSKYIQRDNLWALPNSGRHLMTLILWKLLSSSTFAIAGTLETLTTRLEAMLASGYNLTSFNAKYLNEFTLSDYEDDETPIIKRKKLTEKDKISLKAEIDELRGYYQLANSITHNAKGDALLVALDKGFEKLKNLKAPQKAVIFTESRRTQAYIERILGDSKYKGKTVLFHGGLNTADKRQQVIDDFRDKAQIMIATEAAAEGLNLQFAPMVINYDLPFNPQRIEQRIGRCHRYGQKHDVVVINFLNKNNLADQRVYELLCDKFQLFEGVFGASDSILGSIDTLDFEKRIVEIYQKCRTAKEIEDSFAQLRQSLSPQIDEQMNSIKQKLLENFDEDVTARLKLNMQDSQYLLGRFENMLWLITKHILSEKFAEFNDDKKCFKVTKNPYYTSRYGYKRFSGNYYLDKNADLSERYRMKCSLAQTILQDALSSPCFGGVVEFDLSGYKGKFSNLEALKGKSGHLTLHKVEIIYTRHRENRLVFAGFSDDGMVLDQKQMQRMFELSGNRLSYDAEIDNTVKERLDRLFQAEQDSIIEAIAIENGKYFDEETEKLEKWSQDIKLGMERTLKELDKQIAETRQKSRGQIPLKSKLESQEILKKLESKRNELRMGIYTEQDKIDTEREKLIEDTKKRLTQRVESRQIFTIKWGIV